MKSNADELNYTDAIPRSLTFADRTIQSEGNAVVHGKKYYHRLFTDGCVELVRYNGKTQMWAILCFPKEEQTESKAG